MPFSTDKKKHQRQLKRRKKAKRNEKALVDALANNLSLSGSDKKVILPFVSRDLHFTGKMCPGNLGTTFYFLLSQEAKMGEEEKEEEGGEDPVLGFIPDTSHAPIPYMEKPKKFELSYTKPVEGYQLVTIQSGQFGFGLV